jgi:hypothetical protein
MKLHPKNLSVVSPARYRISVLGILDEDKTDRLGGLTIECQELDPGSGKSKITLIGSLADQAALFGALNALYNMRMPLLSVEYLGDSVTKGENHAK